MASKITTQTVTRPTRIVLSYAALVTLIYQGAVFVQDVASHAWHNDRDLAFIVAVLVGLITLVGPFLPVPVSFDTSGAGSQAGGGAGQPLTTQADSVTKTPSTPDANQAGAPVRRPAARNQRGEFVGPQSSHSPGTTIGPQTTADAPVWAQPPTATAEGNG